MECKLLYENIPFEGDDVFVDFESMGIPRIEDYSTTGMIIRENRPIHTYVYKVMLYPINICDNTLKIIDVPLKYLSIVRYVHINHYEV
jgi:hypothetical protein